VQPFVPSIAHTVLIDVGATTANVKLYNERGPISVRVYNDGSATAWIAFGDSSVTASTTADMPVGAGKDIELTVQNTGNGPLFAAAIAAGATGEIYFTPGRGGH